MSEIYLEEDRFLHEMTRIKHRAELLTMPMLRITTDCTIAGLQYLPEMYYAFRDIVEKYILLVKRDVGLIADSACAFHNYDTLYGNPHALFISWSDELDCDMVVAESAEYNVAPASHMYDDWLFKIYDLDNLASDIIENMVVLIDHIINLNRAIVDFNRSMSFYGDTASSMKAYFYDIHTAVCGGLRTCAQTIIAYISCYWDTYCGNRLLSSNGPDYAFHKGSMTAFVRELDEKASYIRRKHADIPYHTVNLYIDTNYEYNFIEMEPSIRPISDRYRELAEETQSVIDAIDNNEDELITGIQSSIEAPIYDVVGLINSVITNVQGRYEYLNPPEQGEDPIGLEDYNQRFTEIRTFNEENLMDYMCEGISHAGEVNTQFANDITEMNNTEVFLAGSLVLAMSGYGLYVNASSIATEGECSSVVWGALSLSFTLSDLAEDGLEELNIHFGLPEELVINPMRDINFGGNQALYDGARSMVSWGSQISGLPFTKKLIVIGVVALFMLDKYSIDYTIDRLSMMGLDSRLSTLITEKMRELIDMGVLDQLYSIDITILIAYLSGETDFNLVTVGRIEWVVDLIDSRLAVCSYEHSELNDDGYDEDDLNDMGIVGEMAS